MQRYHRNKKLNTGTLWVNQIARVLSHASLVLACVLAVLFACDFFQFGEMSLLSNRLTKYLLLALCVVVIVSTPLQLKCLSRLRSMRRYEKLRSEKENRL